MALMSHQMQSSHVAFPSSTLPWGKRVKINQQQTMLRMLSSAHMSTTSKYVFALRLRIPAIHNSRTKSLRVLSFKENAKNYESGDGLSDSEPANTSVGTSYLPQDGEDPVTNSPKLQDIATHNLFTKWLSLLRVQPLDAVQDGISEAPDHGAVLQSQNGAHAKESANAAKKALCSFLALDAAIKIPLMIFVPFYLIVRVVYGAEVSRELTPLWISGPLVTALYVKLFKWIFALYVFSFKQTVHIVKNLPSYLLVVHQYIFAGKLKEEIRARVCQPVVDIKNADYKKLMLEKWHEFEEWISEKYLDYVESIWPYYCRTIRFLKRANLL